MANLKMECIKRKNMRKYNNEEYNLKYYFVPSYLLDKFYEKQIITKKKTLFLKNTAVFSHNSVFIVIFAVD